MPSSAEPPDILVDTSVAIALLLRDHMLHDATIDALAQRRLGLAGHAAFETVSVLTRLPAPARRAPAVVARLVGENFPGSRFLSAGGAERLLTELGPSRITGGAVYDALVGGAAREHRLPLATLDRRALDTYRALAVEVEVLPG